MNKFPFVASLLFSLFLCGCERYAFSINDRLIHEPPELFNDFELADQGLLSCIQQTIADNKITAADQLSTLTCSHAGIADLKGIERFRKLTSMNLSNNRLTEVKPLLFLPELQNVNLAGNAALHCRDAETLNQHINGNVLLPEHCEK